MCSTVRRITDDGMLLVIVYGVHGMIIRVALIVRRTGDIAP